MDTHQSPYLEERTGGSGRSKPIKRESGLAPAAVARARGGAGRALPGRTTRKAEGPSLELASWDWSFYAGQVKQDRYAFDDSDVRPYFEMRNVLVNGVFFSCREAVR